MTSFHSIAARRLGELLGILAHPNRVRIIEELGDGELDVQGLQQSLGISQTGVSQHLAVLRTHRLVIQRREGRHVFYRVRNPTLARWLLDGFAFVIDREEQDAQALRSAIRSARRSWARKK